MLQKIKTQQNGILGEYLVLYINLLVNSLLKIF